MKIAVITRHAIANYGSLLQAIATQNVIEKTGNKCEIIDFIRKDESKTNSVFTIGRTKTKWNRNYLLYGIYCALRLPESIIADTKFAKMRQKYLKMTPHYASEYDIKENKPVADVYMTGSDQVWGPILCGDYEWAYFLSFCNSNDKKIAFSSSFGKMKIEETSSKKMQQYLSKYDKLAVREDSAVEFLNDMGLQAEQVLDPTLLLNIEEWGNYISNKNRVKGDYVLVYQIHNDPALSKYAIEFAKKAGLPLVRVSTQLHQLMRGGKFIYLPDIGEFLSLVKNARYMVTDSFHGTAFAINFNTQFVEVLPNTGTGSRNKSILKLTGLEDRIVRNLDDFTFIDQEIDFNNANQKLESERIASNLILNELLKT